MTRFTYTISVAEEVAAHSPLPTPHYQVLLDWKGKRHSSALLIVQDGKAVSPPTYSRAGLAAVECHEPDTAAAIREEVVALSASGDHPLPRRAETITA